MSSMDFVDENISSQKTRSPEIVNDNESFFFRTNYSISHQIDIAVSKGIQEFVICLKSVNEQFCRKEECIGKNEIIEYLKCGRKAVSSLCMETNGQFILKVSDADVAKKAFKMKTINNQPISIELQHDDLSSKFLVERICADVPLEYLAEDLELQNIYSLQVERFTKTVENKEVPTKTVLITQIGKSIPEKVKLFYEDFTTHLFSEKSLQCKNCWRFGHVEKNCKNGRICDFCAIHHADKNSHLSHQVKSNVLFATEKAAETEFKPKVEENIQVIEQKLLKTEHTLEQILRNTIAQKMDDFISMTIRSTSDKLMESFDQKMRLYLLNLNCDSKTNYQCNEDSLTKTNQINQNLNKEEYEQNIKISRDNIPREDKVINEETENTDSLHSMKDKQNKEDNGSIQKRDSGDDCDVDSNIQQKGTKSNQGKSINEEDKACSEATIRYSVSNISKLCCLSRSTATFIRNLPWNIVVMPRLNRHVKTLAVFVECNADSKMSTWSCNASIEFRLISQKEGVDNMCKKVQHNYGKHNFTKEVDWGFAHFIGWNEILDPEQGYIKDDTVTFEVFVSADIPHGV